MRTFTKFETGKFASGLLSSAIMQGLQWEKKRPTDKTHKCHHLVALDFYVDIIVEVQLHREHLETNA